jgi:hypothetical protein
MNRLNFFAELKRRNVYKVAVAYIFAGWALSQGIKSQYVSPYALAVVLTALGDKAHAIDELEHGYDDTGFYISLIKVDPFFDDLRGDPRFEAIVQKITRVK